MGHVTHVLIADVKEYPNLVKTLRFLLFGALKPSHTVQGKASVRGGEEGCVVEEREQAGGFLAGLAASEAAVVAGAAMDAGELAAAKEAAVAEEVAEAAAARDAVEDTVPNAAAAALKEAGMVVDTTAPIMQPQGKEREPGRGNARQRMQKQQRYREQAAADVALTRPCFVMSWRRRIPREDEEGFFRLCEEAGMSVEDLGSRVFCIAPVAHEI
ncbi:unnamed protein product [Closterium sp. NIES-54]